MNSKNIERHLKNLIKGNNNFIKNPTYIIEREKTKDHQDPCIIVISCSDSRVSIPTIFNYPHLGVFFEIKTAGQVLNSSDLESIKYAVMNYDVLLIIMLGHTNCGAVIATVESIVEPKKYNLRNEFPTITSSIAPSVEKVIRKHPSCLKKKLIYKSIIENILDKTLQLEFLFGDKMYIVPALYNLSSGEVTFFRN